MADPKRPRAAFAPWDRRELPGSFTVEETAKRVGHYKWIEMRLFEVLGGAGATVLTEVMTALAQPIVVDSLIAATDAVAALVEGIDWETFGVVLAGRETRTLPVAVYNMLSFEQLSWGPLAAAALIVTLPVLILTIIAQRQIVAGLTAGAVKGG